MKYQYKILNYWNDQDDLYVNYTVENLETDEIANCIDYHNTSDIGCDYNGASMEEIVNALYRLIEKNDGLEFNMPKVSELSDLLKYVYDYVCESESDMCYIDYREWEELKEEKDFLEEDITTLKQEIKKYDLEKYFILENKEYKICAFGGLQCCFNDDREKGSEEHER